VHDLFPLLAFIRGHQLPTLGIFLKKLQAILEAKVGEFFRKIECTPRAVPRTECRIYGASSLFAVVSGSESVLSTRFLFTFGSGQTFGRKRVKSFCFLVISKVFATIPSLAEPA